MRQQDQRATLPVDHIRPRQHGGPTAADNLALACLHCNTHKGPNLAGVDPTDDSVHLLFDPRRQRWADHFRYAGAKLVGVTAVGRATIAVLLMNDPEAVEVRQSLVDEGVFPPPHY